MSLDTSTTSRGACCLAQRLRPRPGSGCRPCPAAGWSAGCWPAPGSGRTGCRRPRGGPWCRASGPWRCRRPGRRPARRACGWPGGRCGRLPSCPSCGRRALPARSSAGRCRVPRSGTGSSGRACSTLVSSTNSLAGPVGLALRARARRAAGARLPPLLARGAGSGRSVAPVSSRERLRMRRSPPPGARVEVSRACGLLSQRAVGLRPPPIFATALCEERAGAS